MKSRGNGTSYATITAMRPNSVQFMGNGGKTALTIKADGNIEVGEGLTPDEAGKAVVDAMRHHLQFLIEAEREACAKIADDGAPSLSHSTAQDVAKRIATAIRARSMDGG